MEQFVAPRTHGHAANRSDPKTHFKANRLHACGGVFRGLTVVPGSSVRVSGGPERVPNITQVGSTVPGHPLSKDFIMHTLKRTRLKAVATRKTRTSRTKRDNLILVGKRPIIHENSHWGWIDGSESGSALL